MSTESEVRNYILENFMFTMDGSELNNTDSFLERGLIDSTGILELIFFIEQQFKIKVADKEMVPENLDSVNNIVAYLERKRAGG